MKDSIKRAREDLDEVDRRLIELLARRMATSERIGRLKAASGEAVVQPKRTGVLLERQRRRALQKGLDPDFVEAIWRCIHEESCRLQSKVIQSS